MPNNETKYTVHFKNSDGSHHSTKTMDLDGYIHLLQSTIHLLKTGKDVPYPTEWFEVEKREIIYSTLNE